MNPICLKQHNIAVIGLGYVGLPLAIEFGKVRPVVGFDLNEKRIDELMRGLDRTMECGLEQLMAASHLRFTLDETALDQCQVFIVTVPTPVDEAHRPDLRNLQKASDTVGRHLKRGDIVIYESTVFPGATEEVCVPVLEKVSGLGFNEDFFCGYSPERINPGDKVNTLTTIKKIVSGSTPEITDAIDAMYAEIITAGTWKASSIMVAEASKVIENTQRDLNIALVNELSIIFREMHIDTLDVLEAASTKWNFLPFRPGLVGGHCIGVDPYYLTYKAEQLGYYPQVVLAGRRINDSMGRWVVEQLVLEMAPRGLIIAGAKILVLGLSFKENCPDLRNTRVVDLLEGLRRYGMEPVLVDPWVNAEAAKHEYELTVLQEIPAGQRWSAVVAAVAHHQFTALSSDQWRKLVAPSGVLLDLKGFIPRELGALRL